MVLDPVAPSWYIGGPERQALHTTFFVLILLLHAVLHVSDLLQRPDLTAYGLKELSELKALIVRATRELK